MNNSVLAWHFALTQMRDGAPLAAPGGVERYDGPLSLYVSGLHASRRLIDALKYAPGTLLRRVECVDPVESHDKMVCRERRILWECDMTAALQLFSRKCALDCARMWYGPVCDIEFLVNCDGALPMQEAAWAAWGVAEIAQAAVGEDMLERRLVAYAQAARAGAFSR